MANREPVKALDRYVKDVLSGRIVTGGIVRAAVDRHVSDLETAASRGLEFDRAAASHAIGFFPFLTHSKGEYAGTSFILEPWEAFIIGSLFGWKRADTGLRRFSHAYIELARKNGKTTLAAGLGLYMLVGDDEPGAEIYVAATKRDQAKITHAEAVRMVKRSPGLARMVRVYRDNLNVESTFSKFEPLGADADTLDGLNPSANIIDELHAHRTRKVWDVLDTATGSRSQPLQFAITTAGYDRASICWEQHLAAQQMLEGTIPDDTLFAYIAALDEKDDWQNPDTWIKANPNLGKSVKLGSLRAAFRKVQHSPAAQNAFRRLRLNQWTESVSRFLDLEAWDKCAAAVDCAALEGEPCYGGLDLASLRDLAAFVLYFPDSHAVVPYLFIPRDQATEREQNDKVPYTAWARAGLVEMTPGNVIDYAHIEKRIIEAGERFNLIDIGADRWNLEATRQKLCAEVSREIIVPFGQGFSSMSSPTKELERLVLTQELRHGGHPALRWQASNTTVKTDPAANIKPSKPPYEDARKIDGIVALIMAIGRHLAGDPNAGRSVYEDRGLVVL